MEIHMVFQGGDSPSHSDLTVDPGPSVMQQEFTRLRVRETPDVVTGPRGPPKSDGHDVSQQLKVRDMPVMAEEGRGTLEPPVVNVVEATQTRTSTEGTMRGGIQSDFILVILKLKVGNTIPASNVGGPPENIQMKVVVQGDNGLLAETSPEGLQHPRELEPARSDDFTHLEELPE
jgi:hypothetical protein